MTRLTAPELATLGNQLFTGQRTLTDVSDPYTIEDFIGGLEQCLTLIEERISGISEAQHDFRVPGVPHGSDWNHDQHHFNTPELVTHLTVSLRYWYQQLQESGIPLPELPDLFPPAAHVTGESGKGRGAGGRSDLTPDQTLLELRTTRENLVTGLQTMPPSQWNVEVNSYAFGTVAAQHLVLLMALHSAAHTFQLMETQAHEAYPLA